MSVKWSAAEDSKLLSAAAEFASPSKPPVIDWSAVSDSLSRSFGYSTPRSAAQCEQRYKTIRGKPKQAHTSKGPWTDKEDQLVVELVSQLGAKKWSQIASHLPGRIGKQCRERWHNHLNPDISKDPWSEEEDRLILQSHATLGNKWAEIAKVKPTVSSSCSYSQSLASILGPDPASPRIVFFSFSSSSSDPSRQDGQRHQEPLEFFNET